MTLAATPRSRLLPLLAVLLAACTSDVDGVLSAWKKAGESPGEFKDAGAKLAGGKCHAGRVSGLEATVCTFDSAEAAKKAEEAGFALLGSSFGTAVASGKSVLVLSDPRKEDPTGRRMNTLVKAFQAETD
jgi:hypothetical protein